MKFNEKLMELRRIRIQIRCYKTNSIQMGVRTNDTRDGQTSRNK